MFLVYSESDSGVTYLALNDLGTVATFPVCSYDGQVCKLILLGKLHPMLYWRKFRKFSAVFFFFFFSSTALYMTLPCWIRCSERLRDKRCNEVLLDSI